MANVLFKQGLQSNLDLIRQNHQATEGTFYLTTDSHRLYIGRITDATSQTATACDAVPVNEGVSSVSSIGDLPKVSAANRQLYSGQFYYVTDSNILCVYSGEKGWVQLNPNTDTKIEDVDISVTVNNGVATVNTKVSYTDETGESNGGYKDDSFQVASAGGVKIDVAEVEVDSKTLDKLTVTGEEYTLTSEHSTAGNGSLKLKLNSSFTKENDDHDSVVTILKAGDNVESIKADGTINTLNTTLNKANGASLTISTGNGSVDSTGSSATTSTKGFVIEVKDTDGNQLKASVDPKIVLGTNTDTSYEFDNGTATLPVYTREEIDKKLAGLDAMTFKGLVGTGAPITSASGITASSGDTYKAVSSLNIVTSHDSDGAHLTKADVGDLIIATGDEYRLEDVTTDASKNGQTYTRADSSTGTYTTDSSLIGTIIPSTLEWAIIPAGNDDEAIIHYNGKAISNGIKLLENDITEVLSFKVDGATDGYISVTDDQDADHLEKNTVLIKHNDTTRTDSKDNAASQVDGSQLTFNVVTKVESNATGHVTGVKTQQVTVTDTNGYIGNNYYTASASSDATEGSQTVSIQDTAISHYSTGGESARAIGGYKIKSSSLSISVPTAADTSKVSGTVTLPNGGGNVVTYTQKQDPVIVLDMVWGSF